jgi:hypothetical protein
MVGAYYLVRDLIVSAAAILGAYLWKLGPRLNLLGAVAFGIIGTIVYIKSARLDRQSSLDDMKRELGSSRFRPR